MANKGNKPKRPDPNYLGSGLASAAGSVLKGRGSKTDKAVKQAVDGRSKKAMDRVTKSRD